MRADAADARVVDDDVEPAEVSDRGGESALDLVALRHVGGVGAWRAHRVPRARPRRGRRLAGLISATATSAPASASAWAIPRPRPVPAPVTSATLPSSTPLTAHLRSPSPPSCGRRAQGRGDGLRGDLDDRLISSSRCSRNRSDGHRDAHRHRAVGNGRGDARDALARTPPRRSRSRRRGCASSLLERGRIGQRARRGRLVRRAFAGTRRARRAGRRRAAPCRRRGRASTPSSPGGAPRRAPPAGRR